MKKTGKRPNTAKESKPITIDHEADPKLYQKPTESKQSEDLDVKKEPSSDDSPTQTNKKSEIPPFTDNKDKAQIKDQKAKAPQLVVSRKGGYFFSALIGGITALALSYSLVELNIISIAKLFPHRLAMVDHYEARLKAVEDALTKVQTPNQGTESLQSLTANVSSLQEKFAKIEESLTALPSSLEAEQQVDNPSSVDLRPLTAKLQNQIELGLAPIEGLKEGFSKNQQEINQIWQSLRHASQENGLIYDSLQAVLAVDTLEDALVSGTPFSLVYDIIQQGKFASLLDQNLNLKELEPYAQRGFSSQQKLLTTLSYSASKIRQETESTKSLAFWQKWWHHLESLVTIQRLDQGDISSQATSYDRLYAALFRQDYAKFLQEVENLPQNLQNQLSQLTAEIRARVMIGQIKEALLNFIAQKANPGIINDTSSTPEGQTVPSPQEPVGLFQGNSLYHSGVTPSQIEGAK